jgi:hypothetical protein
VVGWLAEMPPTHFIITERFQKAAGCTVSKTGAALISRWSNRVTGNRTRGEKMARQISLRTPQSALEASVHCGADMSLPQASNDNMDSFEVGYGKPPAARRFAKGLSGTRVDVPGRRKCCDGAGGVAQNLGER